VTLTVLSVAYPLAPVGPDAVGGAEQTLTQLDAALVRSGHHSVVIACEGSRTEGTLVPISLPDGRFDEASKAQARARCREAIGVALRRWPVDVVHLHGVDFHAYLPPTDVPTLATLHLPPSWYPSDALRPTRPRTWLHAVSAVQHRACPTGRHFLEPIENGVPTEALASSVTKRRFALVLGRICPEKGIHLAVEAARRAGIPLLIAGEVFPYEVHQRYFADEVRPRLDALRRFIGPVGFERKRRLLTAARCLLIPSLAPETSSLVAREAAACGTPVIAFPNGALPETVEHGRTGFLVTDVDSMADAIAQSDTLDPDVCRQVARERFSLERMVARYLSTYERLATAGQPVEGAA
jgi:glycosyltransferase involved in cell wall biosynthesis